ncbi:uncharacterized protein TNCT_524011 [Trichonephila clavata]|uniref:Uncharacterized protein n=1 Tax=Trichonephila clavata TaxID=2740835 RepID=A0A8X6LL16_TRICU|nr:uncharacterized protein TNCT_524011 [Trichonephila clavata]
METDEGIPLLRKYSRTMYQRVEPISPAATEPEAGASSESSSKQTTEDSSERDTDLPPVRRPDEVFLDPFFVRSLPQHEEFLGRMRALKSCLAVFLRACIWMRNSLYSDVTQILLNVIRMTWTAFMIYVGNHYVNECPMSPSLPYAILTGGIFACTAVVLRIISIIYSRFSYLNRPIPGIGKSICLMKLIFLGFFIAHLVCHYSYERSNDPSNLNYCNSSLLDYSSWIIGVNIAYVCCRIFAYFCQLVCMILQNC